MPRWRKVRMGKAPERAGDAFFVAPNVGSAEDLGVAVLALLAIVVVVLVVIPLLLFGIELILLGAVIAVGVFARTLLGRPWIVEAMPLDGDAECLRWHVVGLRRSRRVIDEVAASLTAGLDPTPVEGASLIDVADRPMSTPPPAPKPGNPPAPGSVPKLPKTIFNLEKRGGSGNDSAERK